jgi:glycosyltransferase involved in cell wall biosynthesis
MTARPIRVALFPDSLNEVNGVANTCRNFVAYARRTGSPMLLVGACNATGIVQEDSVTHFGLKRGTISFALETDLRYDLAFFRYYRRVVSALRHFRPDVVHITGPSDIGTLGAAAAADLGVPVAASWHTNVHEYAARRLDRILPRWISGAPRAKLLQTIEDVSFNLSARYFQLAHFHFAPNRELIDKLQGATRKPCSLMERGVDLSQFSAVHRDRGEDGQFVIGYVGRLSTEKKVRSFAKLSHAVRAAGYNHVKFVFVGHGKEEQWLRQHIPDAEMTDVLRGIDLGRAYANMDLFAFYSETDTFGNVVLEALASGVPAVVTNKGGPKFIVDHGRSGFICSSDEEFTAAVLRLISSSSLQRDMAAAGRQRAQRASWDSVFASVYETYRRELPGLSEDMRIVRFPERMTSISPRLLLPRPQKLD